MTLALDFGDRFIGMAAGDPPDIPAHRLGTIDQSKDEAMPKILETIKAQRVTKVLVGMPVGLSGHATEQTEKTSLFIKKLRDVVGRETTVETIDERFTSAEAGRIIGAEGGNPESEHAEAARLMLVDYLARKPRLG